MPSQTPARDGFIFKICDADAWLLAQGAGSYTGSTDDQRDGFIHFSTAEQVQGTLTKYFSGCSDLVLLAVLTAPLGAALRFEPSRGGALFPHLHGPLPISAVAWQEPLRMRPDGSHVLPDLAGPGDAR